MPRIYANPQEQDFISVTKLQYIAAGDGISLAVDAAPANGKPTILLSSSVGASLGMWDEFVARCSEDFRIIRYDARGHGKSQIADETITIETLGNDVLRIMDSLNVERATLCGLSLGGLTAQWLGVNHAARFDGIVLANTAANFPPATMWHDRAKAVREGGMSPLVQATIERWFTKPFQEANQKRIVEVAAMIGATSPIGYARCCEILASTDMLPALPALTLPALIICGEKDPSTTVARGEELAKAIPNSGMAILDAAHISAIEAADAFAASVKEFCSTLDSK